MNTREIAPKRVRIHHLRQFKEAGAKFTMLTSYDQYTAGIFDEAGIDTLLVGDSVANNVLGFASTAPVTIDEMIPFVRAVAGSASRALVIGDLPLGSYETGPALAIESAVRFVKVGAHAVKLEGGERSAPLIRAIVDAGIPVIAHIGLTPQSEHQLGGYRIQGRGDKGHEQLRADALAVQAAGASAVVLELVPAALAAAVSAELDIPTIGIGAGAGTDGQVLVWTDFAGLSSGPLPRFVRTFAKLRTTLLDAATEYRDEVEAGRYPAPEHEYDE